MKTYEENKKKTHQKMMVVEDRCKDLKMKISAAQGKVLGIEGEEGKFVVDIHSLNNMSPLKAKEQDQNKQNLIQRISHLERLISDKERQNRQFALKIREYQQGKVREWAEDQ